MVVRISGITIYMMTEGIVLKGLRWGWLVFMGWILCSMREIEITMDEPGVYILIHKDTIETVFDVSRVEWGG